MTLIRIHRFLAALPLLAGAPAFAEDPPSSSQAPSSGFYAGGHVGYMFGNANATLAVPVYYGPQSAGGTSQVSTLIGGVQAGWEHVFPSSIMVGLELDAEFTDFMDFQNILSYRYTPNLTANEPLEYMTTLRGRLGYAMGSWTPYLTAGLAVASLREDLLNTQVGLDHAASSNLRLGYAFGAGIDKALDKRWSARAEYLYTAFPLSGFVFNPQARYDSQYNFSRFRVGLNYHFGVDGEDPHISGESDDRGPGSWEIHGQTTLIYQGYPAFSSAFADGPQSLPQLGQSRNTWTAGLFFGIRLWEGGELYYNPELLQGFGLSNTTGIAGFPNGEAQKSNFPFPRYSTSRLFLRQTFGLGGETEKIEGEYGQLSGTKDVSRLTIQVGRFPVHDLFDTNDYAQDPRVDFMNWSIWASGAFDYAADKVGLTYGIAAELNQPDWAFRLGYFLVGDHPNSNVMSPNLFATGQYSAELELRYKLFDHRGEAKFGGFVHYTYAANFNDVLNVVNNTGLDAPDAAQLVRRVQPLWGYYINLQQEVADDLGAFVRWSWNDGQSEYSAFTDISHSLSAGVSIKGERWGRPDDTVGVGGAVNWASPQFVNFLAAGGTGILIGDGQLQDSGAEHIVEGYYAWHVAKGVTLTADYQFIGNPAYNADRGPVHVYSGRLRMDF